MRNLCIITFLFPAFLAAQKQPEFSYKVYGNVANYFSSKEEMLDFFDFRDGETIAEIGSYDGANVIGFSLLTKNVLYYAQDIDSSRLNLNTFKAKQKAVSKYTDELSGNKFMFCIGDEKNTNLPDSIFDKIIIVSAFHEFTYIPEMLDDISRKLKITGRVYILDATCLTKGHKNYSSHEVDGFLRQHGFTLINIDKDGKEGMLRMIFCEKIIENKRMRLD